MEHDLVVFVPGFLGTRLCRDGQDVWARCSRSLIHSPPAAGTLAEVALPPGLGDALPEDRFRLDAGDLLTSPDSVPGLTSCMGYPDIRAALGDPVTEQFVPFTYDWRLSHRLAARQLRARLARELDRWSEQVDAHYPDRLDDPGVILVCHSTGGLIGRHYLECEDGRRTARALVTLGTPQKGLVQAARLLAGHAIPGTGGPGADARARLNEVLRDWALDLPAVAEMLPVYAAVRAEGKSRPRTVADHRYPVPGLPAAAVRDVLGFHEKFRSATDGNRRADPEGRLPYTVHCLGSGDFPTPEAITLSSDGSYLTSGENSALGPGDGTVPRLSALADWAVGEHSPMLWTGFRNADMASSAALRDVLIAVRRGSPPGSMLAGDEGIALHFPDSAAVAGQPFAVELLGHNLLGRNLRTFMWRSGRAAKQPVVFEEHGTDRYRAELEAPPGRWWVEAVVDSPKRFDRKDVTVFAA
ncbi:esterase/lipase family protein [Streptomyces sp. NPDC015171]|uniref:esterase/lipase family protein n=1 Tax=Streptomyces sp. NPDC015171 TaxID=3364945 RepID=UPI0036F99241